MGELNNDRVYFSFLNKIAESLMRKTQNVDLANVTIFHNSRWVREGCVGSARVRVGSARAFRYQDSDISNAKCSHWESSPTRGSNANDFVFWWNIGFKVLEMGHSRVSKGDVSKTLTRCLKLKRSPLSLKPTEGLD